jgi:3-methyladenine DNA glycosylase AlkD
MLSKNQLENYLAELTNLLIPLGSPRRSLSAKSDKNSRLEFLAIRVPVLKKVATKDFTLPHLNESSKLEVWDFIWQHSPYFEVMAVPLFYYRCKGLRLEPALFEVVKHWISRVENWGHCDEFSYILSCLTELEPKKLLPFLLELNTSHNTWQIRASIISTVHYAGKNSVYLPPNVVFSLLENHLSHRDKYVAKAVGWVLREMRRKYPQEVEEFVKENIDDLSAVALKISSVLIAREKRKGEIVQIR